jgi:starch phosphorylase
MREGAKMMIDRMALYTVAYFSMEIALDNEIPTYSGGLGVLAGDLLRSAADLGLPMVGVSLLHRKGYFLQDLDAEGRQSETPVAWTVHDFLQPMDATCQIEVEGRQVTVRAWRYVIQGAGVAEISVFFLDTDVPGNEAFDRTLTDHLYGGDEHYRLCQEVVLGVGGIRLLRALGYKDIERFHMNEGHAALLALELFTDELERTSEAREEAIERVKRRCVFTTHTPVTAGHDQFSLDLARQVLSREQVRALQILGCCDSSLNMTFVGLQLSHYVNGVAKRHGELSRSMFPGYPISSITNGVHSATWTAPAFRSLYDQYIPDWRLDSFSLRYAVGIPLHAIWQAHEQAKRRLAEEVNRRVNAGFDHETFTLGFARRATAYKRPNLLFHDIERLRSIAKLHGGLQLVYAGKAHPRDEYGKGLIYQIVQHSKALGAEIKLAYLPNYDMASGQLLTAGVDVWLNTPEPPYEASGTSGMKAAHNGVPSLSVLDGWWLEGHAEGVTGWAIGDRERSIASGPQHEADAQDLYYKLEAKILPVYQEGPMRWAEIMRYAIALNASFFNTQRMVMEYLMYAYQDR